LEENIPTVLDVLKVFKKHFSVETIVLSNETREVSPTRFKAITENYWKDAEIETITHLEFRKRARGVRAIVRTADFTAYSNVLLISGPGDRWYLERQITTEA
jgi:D-ribose pyranase